MQQQGLHVSEGLVGNIVRTYRKNEQPLHQNVGINNATSSIISTEIGQVAKDGGPHSHLINETNADNYEQKDLIVQNEPEIDFADTAYHTFFPKDERLLVAPDTNQQISEP